MRSTILAIALALPWSVAAQVPQQQPSSISNAPAHNVFVVTGCLTASADRTAGFKLTDALPVGRGAAGRGSEAGAVGTSGVKASYELEAASGVNAQGMKADALKAHAGQRVEVILRPVQTTAPAPSTAPSVAVQSAKPVDGPPERFSVTAIKRVTGTCS